GRTGSERPRSAGSASAAPATCRRGGQPRRGTVVRARPAYRTHVRIPGGRRRITARTFVSPSASTHNLFGLRFGGRETHRKTARTTAAFFGWTSYLWARSQ